MMPLQTQPALTHPVFVTKELFILERQGRFEECFAQLGEIWSDTAELPFVKDFEPPIAAEVMLRCGSLIGFYGHHKQIPNAQETSKNLLTNARSRFVDIGDIEKIAETENYLSLAYWRNGELNEAETWNVEALSRDLAESNVTRLYSQVIKSLILLSQKEFESVRANFTALEDVFLEFADNFLIGNLYNNAGVAQKNLGNISEALRMLEIGRDYYLKSENKIHVALAENNLSQLYKDNRSFSKAHNAIDRSTKLFKQIKDKTRAGFSLDTKAQIYYAEAKYEAALKTIEEAIRILKKSENALFLIETILTKSKILLFLDNFASATLCLADAIEIARVQIGEEYAKGLVTQFEHALTEKNAPKPVAIQPEKQSAAKENLKVVLPASISHYDDYQGIWINNSHLDSIGLKKGSLAIVADGPVKRGDLAAIREIDNDQVSCGFYDADFGIVCLDGIDSQPQLFNEAEIKMLGKIIGYCNSQPDAEGQMIVEEIKP